VGAGKEWGLGYWKGTRERLGKAKKVKDGLKSLVKARERAAKRVDCCALGFS
jgi:hypothetical protein